MSSTLTINANLASLNAQRRLQESSDLLAKSYQRVSSGLRINRSSDDAAGLAIASSINLDSRVYTQGIRNLNDTVSAYSIAEGATQQLSNMVIRIRELAEQSSNGTITLTQRRALDAEADALVSEYNRIVVTTSFNGQNLLDGTLSTLSTQNGYGDNGSLTLTMGLQLRRAVGDGTYLARNPAGLGVGSLPLGVITADLTRDGQADLISSDYGSNALSVFVSNGDGTFFARSVLSSPGNPENVAVGDVNGDGKFDLVSANYSSDTYVVFLGNGDGTFFAGTGGTAGSAPRDVSIADVNGDGKQDLVTANYFSGGITVMMGNGNGTFRAPRTYSTGSSNESIMTADVNGDGRMDIITSGGSSLNFHFGNGDGSFRARVSNPMTSIRAFDLADINGDGFLDAAAANSSGNTINMLLGNGDGTFRVVGAFNSGAAPRSVHFADIDGDGTPDVISADSTAGRASVYLANANGTLKARLSYVTGANVRDVIAADFNSDGRLDLVSTDSASTSLSLLLGNGGTSSLLPLLNLNTQGFARGVLDQMQTALNRIVTELGSMGSSQSRLQTATNNLVQMRENFDRAQSQIMDVDVAEESASLVRLNILRQAGAAVLGQANNQPALALRLLNGL